MGKTRYAAGFRFVVRTSDQCSGTEDRRVVMSHASTTRWKRRKDATQLHSWIDPRRRLDAEEQMPKSKDYPTVSIPGLVGGSFSATQLPPGIEPSVIEDLVQLINFNQIGMYPYEICLQVHPVQRGWFPYMIGDICCIHSMMFSVRAFVDGSPDDGQCSRLAAFHFHQCLRILQARINAFERGQKETVFRDSTIMVIITLAQTAELTGDFKAAQNHVDGLLKIVNLKGGLKAMNTHNNLQVKICRADLGLALHLGTPPRLFQENIEWNCFIAGRGLIRCAHQHHADLTSAFVDKLDSKLQNCWNDIHAFSCLSNLAYQTTRKLSPETYNEMVVSILYRLTQLSFTDDPLQEIIRVALLVYCTTIFLTRSFRQQPCDHLSELFKTALFNLCHASTIIVPPAVMLWLLLLYHVTVYKGPSVDLWGDEWLDRAVSIAGVDTWIQAHPVLRSVMWVDFVHNSAGQKAFMAAIERLKVVGPTQP
ncbi:hypothetical protein EDD36DRAFT_287556 [Exophiala viscosa]|uniref:Transcription factor domain-containing protein n=1 Tax=Exophiala viscosa TaxID=2486360 RepID=A0AAN6DSH2_9EURO|nr:hypothetical protein EDD36DRAFT_287556 [Exophiala viscosa]